MPAHFKKLHLTPVRLTVYSFIGLILLGTLLLCLPMATGHLKTISFVDAFFTATSAVCVTGLVVKDTGQFFSLFGQGVILFLIQLGGLGIMTLYASLPVIFGKQLRPGERKMFSALFDVESYSNLKSMLVCIIKYTVVVELLGAFILTLRFYKDFHDWGKSIYYGVFHAVSAFCNAGFVLFSNGLESYRGDVVVNIVIVSLFILGGLGFWVLYQIINRRSFKKLSAHAKLVLVTTALFIFIPGFVFFHVEFNHALAGQGGLEKLLSTLMQITTPRTAGFNSLDFASLSNASIFLICVLMFVGAAPGGTGGGVKTTTVGLMFLSIRSIFKGQSDIQCYGRYVAKETVTKSVAISVIAFSIISFFIFCLMLTEEASFLMVFFEVFSAFGTVGLTLGLTPHLTVMGKILICLVMFVGRIGTLSLIFMLGHHQRTQTYKYPVGRFMVG